MSAEAIVVVDSNGVIQLWTAGTERMFGYRASEAVGQTLDLIVPAEYREAHWKGFRRALGSGQAAIEGQVTPFPVRHASGEIIERVGRLTLIRRPRSDVVAAVVVFEEPHDMRD